MEKKAFFSHCAPPNLTMVLSWKQQSRPYPGLPYSAQWPSSSSGCHQLCLAWFINSFSASHLVSQLIPTICARQQSYPRLTACYLGLIKGVCSHSQAGSNKASACLDADSFACSQFYMVGSPLMEEDMYLDLFLDHPLPYTIQVSLAATLLRTRAGVGRGDLSEMTNPKRQAVLFRLLS